MNHSDFTNKHAIVLGVILTGLFVWGILQLPMAV